MLIHQERLLTRLSPDVCQVRLQGRVRSWRNVRSWAARRSERPVTGTISRDGFSIAKYGGLPAYALKPRASGSFHQTPTGTQIDVRVTRRMLPLLVLCAVAWGGALGLLLTIYRPMAQVMLSHQTPFLLAWTLVTSVVPLVVGLLYCLYRGYREQRFLLDFLRTTLETITPIG
jgi:hypothetical protein